MATEQRPIWIDSHCHLNDAEHFPDLPPVLTRAADAGVAAMLVVGVDRPSSAAAVALAEQHPSLYAVVGIQPNHVHEATDADWQTIVYWLDHPKVVALGESGLDRYWNFAPLDLQQAFFRRHLELARARDLPLVIHMRECEADIVTALSDFADQTGHPIRGVMHSFTGSKETAAACVALGLHISFAGMLTFKSNLELREVAGTVPTDRLLVETDAPYLTPHPHRGQRPNEPALVIHTGACLAQIHGMSVPDLARLTTANACRLFSRLPAAGRPPI